MTEIRTDYSDIHFTENGKLKLLIIVGTGRRSSAWQQLSISAGSILT